MGSVTIRPELPSIMGKSTPETWADQTRQYLTRSCEVRESSCRLREDIEATLTRCQCDMWRIWKEVNQALSCRIQEVMDARNKDQAHLQKIMQEMADTEKTIEYLKKAIIDKQAPLKVAQSRLRVRLDRPNMEACDDLARNRLIAEVDDIDNSLEHLQKQLRQAEAVLQNLLVNKADLEADLSIKNKSIFIDREQCLGSRKTLTLESDASAQY